jgi:hypothetical protein
MSGWQTATLTSKGFNGLALLLQATFRDLRQGVAERQQLSFFISGGNLSCRQRCTVAVTCVNGNAI